MNGTGYYQSPTGLMKIRSEGDSITEILFVADADEQEHLTPVIDQCILELEEYFSKGRKFFTIDLQLKGTEFQKKVWTELLTIPFGSTISYEELAIRVGDIKSIRAVGTANGQNPVAVIVPCHRVIGKNGDLTGYAGGLPVKEWLLYHEGSILKQLSLF